MPKKTRKIKQNESAAQAFCVDDEPANPLRKSMTKTAKTKSPAKANDNIIKKPSFAAGAKAAFKVMLEDEIADFQHRAIVQNLNGNTGVPTHWAIGNSLIEARFLCEALPKEHIRCVSMPVPEGGFNSEWTFISEAAVDAIFAWRISGGESGPVELVEAKAKKSNRPHVAREMFDVLLSKVEPSGFAAPVLVEWHEIKDGDRTDWRLGKTKNEVKNLALALPQEHVRRSTLRAFESPTKVLADVVQFSSEAMEIVEGWYGFECPVPDKATIKTFKAIAAKSAKRREEKAALDALQAKILAEAEAAK